MALKHSRFSLPIQIALPAVLSIILIMIASFVFTLPVVREGAMTRKKEMIKNLVDTAISILSDINDEITAGKLTPEQGRSMAKKHLKAMRYGKDYDEYFFILSDSKAVLMHPDNLFLEGQPTGTIMDKSGKPLGPRMLLAAANPDGDYLEYLWARRGQQSVVEKKISYVREFTPWRWIVGTGVYLDDVEQESGMIIHRIVLITLTAMLLAGALGLFIVLQAAKLKRARDEADLALARNEHKYQILFENSADPTLIVSSCRILNCNNAALTLFGYPEKFELIGRTLQEVSAAEQPDGRPQAEAADQYLNEARISGFLQFEWLHRRKDGSIFPCEVSLTPLPNEEDFVYYATIRDITRRKNAERVLQETNTLLRSLLDNSPSLIWLKDPAGRYRMVNRQFEDTFRCQDLNIAGKTDAELFPAEVQAFLSGNDRTVLKEERSLRTDEEILLEGRMRTYLALKFPVRDNEGAIAGLCCIATDITDRKRLEQALRDLNENLELKVNIRTSELEQANHALQSSLQQLQQATRQLVETEKMAALGELVAGVAHEINTPVGIGVTAASHLQERSAHFRKLYEAGELTRDDLEEYLNLCRDTSAILLNNLQRAAEQVSSFKRIAVDQSNEEVREFNFRDYLNEILVSLHPQYRRTKHSISVNCPDDILLCSHPGAFSQIFSNLILNSLIHGFEHIESGRITIAAKASNGKLYIDYNDNGKGIPPQLRPRLFTPFFTTRRGQGGSGLGMHITYNLVTRKLGGTIHCHSQPGYGTTFVIAVPLRLDSRPVGSEPDKTGSSA